MAEYGNVPEDDIAALHTAAKMAGTVADGLPASLSTVWRDIAYETVLDGILRDWVQNGTNVLDHEDEADLHNLVSLTIDVALQQPEQRQDAAFRLLIRNAVSDWVDNWNGDDEVDEEDYDDDAI